MRLIRFSVNHPVSICMLMAALFMGGGYSVSRMNVELLPGIAIPTILVSTGVPKTSPERIHSDVTLLLEETLNGVSDLVSVNSISLEGESRLILEFDWGCNIQAAEIEVREKVGALKLPESAEKPIVKRYDPSSAPVFRFDILGKGLSTSDLRSIAEKNIRPRLERLSGVAEIDIVGGTDPEFRVIGNKAKLDQYSLTVLSLVRCISQESTDRKGGSIEIGGGNVASLRILGKANSIEDLENLVVVSLPTGETIRVRDVASVIRTNKETEGYARIDGVSSVGLSIKKTSDGSIVDVIQRVQKEVDLLELNLKKQGVSIQVSQDDSAYVLSSQTLVFTSIVQGIALAGILLFLFLRDIRATLIVVVATPISLMAATIFLHGFGISRNVLTLGGMGLAAGMTLDSSIVLIESIYKQLSLGQNAKEAAIRGASEVAMGIFSSTMTTVVVFLPILFIPGLMQEIFTSLAHAVIWTVLMSMVVGILFIPMVCARLLSPVAQGADVKLPRFGELIVNGWQWTCQKLNDWDAVVENNLANVIKKLLRVFSVKLGVVLFLIGLSLFSLKFLPGRGFLPPGNVDELWIRFEAPAGSSLDYVDERVRLVESLLQTAPYNEFVKSVSADIKNDEGKLFVRLYPARPDRWHSLSKCVEQLRLGCSGIPDLSGNTFVTLVDKIRGSTRAPIILKVFSRNPDMTLAEADQLRDLQSQVKKEILPVIKAVPSALYQRVRVYEAPKEIVVSTQNYRETLVERGLSTQQVSDTIRASVYGVKAATVIEDDGETDVSVFLEDSNGEANGDFDRNSIVSLKVRSSSTGLLHRIGDISLVGDQPTSGSVVLERTNRKPIANLESHFGPYDVTGETIGDVTDQIDQKLAALPGFGEAFDYQVQGEAKDTIESFADATLAFLISVVLIYMIMCSQFEKFSDPLAIMVTVPLARVGSVSVRRFAGEITSLGAFVGSVILCGVVVNNGIILVEYINILRKRGVERDEAIIQGSVRKLRSILITSLTSILGMAPLVFGVGEGTEMYKGVAAVIVGGLLVSTPLTLLALPLLYSLLDELAEFFQSLSFRIASVKDRMVGGNA